MSYIVDRRLNSKNKSTVNRERFLRRYRGHIKKAVSDAIDKRSITDMASGEKISIPSKDISEPSFSHGEGGIRDRVLPGNDEFITGDKIKRPQSGSGGSGNGDGASDSGEGDDDFVFQITQEEFLDFMFEDLALPNLVKRQLAGNEEFKTHRAGVSHEGSPGQVNIVRTLRSANARRIALTGKKRKALKVLEEQLADITPANDALEDACSLKLQAQIAELKAKIKGVPWLDDFDLKYNLQVKYPVPQSRAVMFCLMDVSGSMDQATKDVAKRFFLLLFLFLQRNYEKTDVVFIRHHTSAKEVDEQEFFYSRETGGTIVSSALKLMDQIIKDRYPPEEWNIYGAQASDGDNWNDDSHQCYQLLTENIMPAVQYFSYIEITPRDRQALWHAYEKVSEQFPEAFALRHLVSVADIYPVFRDLFKKQAA
ncbi:YeaH/YhbH family protein [Marinagarivorans algicola]|uniref:YeaH/YhbH family protein n=1 Tax=Marinagarivorans algicola TaxID=1513270 RepID=UPI0006B9E062|nr:YeaH/YhbH family protein [Marinagarivorans algicola]